MTAASLKVIRVKSPKIPAEEEVMDKAVLKALTCLQTYPHLTPLWRVRDGEIQEYNADASAIFSSMNTKPYKLSSSGQTLALNIVFHRAYRELRRQCEVEESGTQSLYSIGQPLSP